MIRTLAMRPDILLLDEPMSALDAQSRLAISDDIYKIIKNEGITAIMVTHDIAEAVSMSDKVIVLTKRPAVIKKIYEINLENSSTPINNRNSLNPSVLRIPAAYLSHHPNIQTPPLPLHPSSLQDM